jgi:hypothetical protein
VRVTDSGKVPVGEKVKILLFRATPYRSIFRMAARVEFLLRYTLPSRLAFLTTCVCVPGARAPAR